MVQAHNPRIVGWNLKPRNQKSSGPVRTHKPRRRSSVRKLRWLDGECTRNTRPSLGSTVDKVGGCSTNIAGDRFRKSGGIVLVPDQSGCHLIMGSSLNGARVSRLM